MGTTGIRMMEMTGIAGKGTVNVDVIGDGLTSTMVLKSGHRACMVTFRDPIANPSELEAVMRSACQQPEESSDRKPNLGGQ